jgi:hypothetical protein
MLSPDTADWAEALPDAFLTCRDFGHSWKPWRASLTSESTFVRVLRCQRCRTERTQELSVSGHRLSASYSYPDGYQAPPGSGSLDVAHRDAIRLISTMRLVERSQRKAS